MKGHDATDPKNFRGSLSRPRKPMLETQAITRLLSHRTAMLESLGSSLGDSSNSFIKVFNQRGGGRQSTEKPLLGARTFTKMVKTTLALMQVRSE